MKSKWMTLWVGIGIFFAATSLVYASEGAPAGPMDFLWKVVNFAILFGILYYFAKNPIVNALQSSAEKAKQELDEAQKAKQAIADELQHFQEKLANMKKEADEMVAQAKNEAAQERQRIIAEGEALAEKIKEQAQLNVQHAYKRAEQELREWVAHEAIKLAEERMKAQMDDTRQESLVKHYLRELTPSGGIR